MPRAALALWCAALALRGGGARACTDYAAEVNGSPEICSYWVETRSCDLYFCKTCLLRGWCDATCDYCVPTPAPIIAPTARPPSPSTHTHPAPNMAVTS